MCETTQDKPVRPVIVANEDTLSLPAWVYEDPDFFTLEREKIFLPAWHLVCHTSDIPNTGDYESFSIYNELAIVVRDENGEIRAFHNVCRHRAARLLDGDHGNCGRKIVCPYHAWTYQLNGRLTGVPFLEEYEHFDKAEHGLKTIEHEVFAGFIFVRFRAGGPPLSVYMAPIAEEMALYRTAQMRPLPKTNARLREVNWKNASDNYVDALHIRIAHRGLDGLLGDSYQLTIDRGVHKIFSEIGTANMPSLSNAAYRKYLPRVEHLPEDRQRMWTYYKLWPSLMFDVYPDQIDFMQFIPLTPTTCILRGNAYALNDNRRDMRAVRYLNTRINRDVNREDKALIERVQAGMGSSSFIGGPLGKNEICLRDFARQMRQTIPIACKFEKPPQEEIDAAKQEFEKTKVANQTAD